MLKESGPVSIAFGKIGNPNNLQSPRFLRFNTDKLEIGTQLQYVGIDQGRLNLARVHVINSNKRVLDWKGFEICGV